MVDRDTRLNGSTVGDIERSGLLFLRTCEQPTAFTISLPLMLVQIVAETFELTHDIFTTPRLFRPFEHSDPNIGIPDLVAAVDKFTYRLLTRDGKSRQVELHEIYRGHAKGSSETLKKLVTIEPHVEVVECPKYIGEREPNEVTDWRHVVVRAAGQQGSMSKIDFTTKRYIVIAPRMASTADIYAPHAAIQIKSSWYAEDSQPIPPDQPQRIKAVQDELEKVKKHLARSKDAPTDWNFAFISLHPFRGSLDELPERTVLVCGKDCTQYLGVFASHVSFHLREAETAHHDID